MKSLLKIVIVFFYSFVRVALACLAKLFRSALFVFYRKQYIMPTRLLICYVYCIEFNIGIQIQLYNVVAHHSICNLRVRNFVTRYESFSTRYSLHSNISNQLTKHNHHFKYLNTINIKFKSCRLNVSCHFLTLKLQTLQYRFMSNNLFKGTK